MVDQQGSWLNDVVLVWCLVEQHHEEKNQNQSCDPRPSADGAAGSSGSSGSSGPARAVSGSPHLQTGVGGTDHLPLSSTGLF